MEWLAFPVENLAPRDMQFISVILWPKWDHYAVVHVGSPWVWFIFSLNVVYFTLLVYACDCVLLENLLLVVFWSLLCLLSKQILLQYLFFCTYFYFLLLFLSLLALHIMIFAFCDKEIVYCEIKFCIRKFLFLYYLYICICIHINVYLDIVCSCLIALILNLFECGYLNINNNWHIH